MSPLQVVLSGGPTAIPVDELVQLVDRLDERVKLLRGNGRDHFAYFGETAMHDGQELPRFDWVTRTSVAE